MLQMAGFSVPSTPPARIWIKSPTSALHIRTLQISFKIAFLKMGQGGIEVTCFLQDENVRVHGFSLLLGGKNFLSKDQFERSVQQNVNYADSSVIFCSANLKSPWHSFGSCYLLSLQKTFFLLGGWNGENNEKNGVACCHASDLSMVLGSVGFAEAASKTKSGIEGSDSILRKGTVRPN